MYFMKGVIDFMASPAHKYQASSILLQLGMLDETLVRAQECSSR